MAKSAQDIVQLIDERGIEYIKVGVFDIDGVLRGKYLKKDKFLSALDTGFGFCDVVLGWDSNDQLYDNVKFTGWHTAYPDAPVRLVPDSARELPLEPDTLLVLGEFTGAAEKLCPRGVLRRVLERADAMGLAVQAACEYEFFLFEETPHSVREKNYQSLKSVTPGFFGYSVLRNSVHAEIYHDLLRLCQEMEMPLEGLHTETGPGVIEAALLHDTALAAADNGALFKTFTKVWAQRLDMMATFMAKWSSEYPGQSGHIHISLQHKDSGANAFYDAGEAQGMAAVQRWFVGGQQQLMPEFLAMVASTVNSYRRMVPGMWAPLDATWGIENRTCALRVIPGGEKSQRVEYRIAAADMNPYLAMAAAIASGLQGIEDKIEPTAAVVGNAYDQTHPGALRLPQTLYEAAERLRDSAAARALFGSEFVEHFSQTRIWEEREFRKAVTDWELQRYFEII
ncbi:glutamine synthetase [Exilibacterium tricleocarpae]|uniref:Glutamine synthetase n=1 Tax=Exilibacterium tricleocarpae TaxID=2591008 RepID=A0A545TNG2_9GAMM|nr:glutamine synthetase [Exilibacterium tricleocarpae]TQV78763.1 glutamine synthetase [Exilibacterium tricleocarpae]